MKQSRGNALAKILDRIIGIPILAGISCFPRHKKSTSPINSLAIVSIGCIGDTLLLDGPLRDLLTTYPQCKVTLFASKANTEMATMLSTVHKVVTLPLGNPIQAIRKLRAKHFDICIDAGQWARISAIYARMIPARQRIGFASPDQHRHFAFDTPIKHRSNQHEIENFRDLFVMLNEKGNNIPSIDIPIPSKFPDQPYVVFHMIPSGKNAHMKEWAKERWKLLAEYCVQKGLTVLYSGSSADSFRTEAQAKIADNPLIKSIAGKTTLPELAFILQNAQIVVSVNTGIMHLAAATGARLIALNGPTSSKRWGPVAAPESTISLNANSPCAPCLHLGFEYGCNENKCMESIQVKRVIEAMKILLP